MNHNPATTTLLNGTKVEYIGGSRVCVGSSEKGHHDLFGVDDAIDRAIVPLIQDHKVLTRIAKKAREVADDSSGESCDGLVTVDISIMDTLIEALEEAGL
jgi:hypothetical protein